MESNWHGSQIYERPRAAVSLLRDGWPGSAGRRPYERYTSSDQEKGDSEDNDVWHSALRFLRSRRLKYTPSGIAQQGEH